MKKLLLITLLLSSNYVFSQNPSTVNHLYRADLKDSTSPYYYDEYGRFYKMVKSYAECKKVVEIMRHHHTSGNSLLIGDSTVSYLQEGKILNSYQLMHQTVTIDTARFIESLAKQGYKFPNSSEIFRPNHSIDDITHIKQDTPHPVITLFNDLRWQSDTLLISKPTIDTIPRNNPVFRYKNCL